MLEQMIIGNLAQIIVFKIIEIKAESFLYHLFDVLIDDRIALAAARSADYGCSTIRILNVDSSVVPFLFIKKTGRQIDRMFVIYATSFLREALIGPVERIIEQADRPQAAGQYAGQHQAEIAEPERYRIRHIGCETFPVEIEQPIITEK